MNKKKLLVAAITTLTFGLGINSVNANMIDTSYIQDSARAHKLIYGTDRNTKINKLKAKKLNKNRQSSQLNKVVLADSTDSLTETAMHGNGTLSLNSYNSRHSEALAEESPNMASIKGAQSGDPSHSLRMTTLRKLFF